MPDNGENCPTCADKKQSGEAVVSARQGLIADLRPDGLAPDALTPAVMDKLRASAAASTVRRISGEAASQNYPTSIQADMPKQLFESTEPSRATRMAASAPDWSAPPAREPTKPFAAPAMARPTGGLPLGEPIYHSTLGTPAIPLGNPMRADRNGNIAQVGFGGAWPPTPGQFQDWLEQLYELLYGPKVSAEHEAPKRTPTAECSVVYRDYTLVVRKRQFKEGGGWEYSDPTLDGAKQLIDDVVAQSATIEAFKEEARRRNCIAKGAYQDKEGNWIEAIVSLGGSDVPLTFVRNEIDRFVMREYCCKGSCGQLKCEIYDASLWTPKGFGEPRGTIDYVYCRCPDV